MTLDEFIEALSGVAGGWLLIGVSMRRGGLVYDCPITAVCREQGGPVSGVQGWREAGQYLELDARTAEMIMSAADVRYEGGNLSVLRRRMLAAVGLREGEDG